MGGGIARLDCLAVDGGVIPVLRPWSGNADDGPFALASNILVPFSNRISGGGFAYGEHFHDVRPNLAGEAFPIHGDGFQRRWHLTEVHDTQARLECLEGAIGPFRYHAAQTFSLADDALLIDLALKNIGDDTLPFGAGFHPWFPRDNATRLRLPAEAVWLEDENHLPAGLIRLESASDWSFAESRPMPQGWINNAFAGWTGEAIIEQREITVRVTASDNLSTAIVFSPSSEADFVCVEPVSHPVDAFNMKGHPGLVALDPGQSMECWMKIEWQRT
nr:aldose 1-epimerase [Rhizobium setariae]